MTSISKINGIPVGGGSGHTIYDAKGNALTQRSGLQFEGLQVIDDSNGLTPQCYTPTLAANGVSSGIILKQIVSITASDVLYFKVASGTNTGNTNCYINDICITVLRVV